MSLKSEVVISFEELRAVASMVSIATKEIFQQDPLNRIHAYEADLATQVVAGIKSAMLTKLRSMPAGDHLRDLYWDEAVIEPNSLPPSEEEIAEFNQARIRPLNRPSL